MSVASLRSRAYTALTRAGALLLLVGCVETTSTETPVAVAVVELSTSSLVVAVGSQAQITATPKSASGKALTARTVTWTSSNSSVATVSATGTVTGVNPGTAILTASSGGVSSIGATVTVPVPSAITIALSPNAVSVQQGASTNATVLIGRTNYTSAVSITATGAPAGVTVSLNPASTAGNSSTATVSVSGATPVGTYGITFTASGVGVPSASSQLTLTVQQAGDFTLSTSPSALTIATGSNGTSIASIVRTNFTADVGLSFINLPAGFAVVFVADTLRGPSTLGTTFTVHVAGGVTAGTYQLTLRGTGGGLTRTATLTVTVTTPNVSLAVTPTSVSVQQGASATATLNVTRAAFTGNVTPTVTAILTDSGTPANISAGFTVTFNPASITGVSSTITVNVGSTLAPGTYNVVISAPGAPGNPSTTLAVTVTAKAVAPVVSTDAATQITATSAIVNGTVFQDGQPYTIWFEIGTSHTLSTFIATNTGTGPNVNCPGTTTCGWLGNLTGLNRGTVYYFRIVASNAGGTARGDILTFTTLP